MDHHASGLAAESRWSRSQRESSQHVGVAGRTCSVTFGKTTQHMPPASPAVVGSSHQDSPEHTLFLVGAYARYNWPYVWVRSNLGKFGQGTADKDLPLDLRTTTQWKDKGAFHSCEPR
jgi:hypothetical protein